MFARLVGHHPRIMFCLIVFSFAILLCFLLQYSCTIFSFPSVGFRPIFLLFFVLWILLASQPRLARVSCFIRRAERTRSPAGIYGCKYRPIFSLFFLKTNSFGHSFLQGVFLLTACSSCRTHWKSPKLVEMLISS